MTDAQKVYVPCLDGKWITADVVPVDLTHYEATYPAETVGRYITRIPIGDILDVEKRLNPPSRKTAVDMAARLVVAERVSTALRRYCFEIPSHRLSVEVEVPADGWNYIVRYATREAIEDDRPWCSLGIPFTRPNTDPLFDSGGSVKGYFFNVLDGWNRRLASSTRVPQTVPAHRPRAVELFAAKNALPEVPNDRDRNDAFVGDSGGGGNRRVNRRPRRRRRAVEP